jgi:starch synthase
MASSEAVPFAKTGGLADVATALSKSLARAGHEVWLIVPHYPQSIQKQSGLDANIELTGETLDIPIGTKRVAGRILKSPLADSDVNVLLIDQPDYFDRPGLYQENGEDFSDNCERFVFFSRAVLEATRLLNMRPDVIHANDWQTGLVPALLALEHRETPGFEKTASIFTIHNMAFQGQFWHWDMALTGIDWKHFNTKEMEYYGDINLLKTGIVFCDIATTVSPTYAREIQTEEFGCGLHGVLQKKGDRLVGILNGVDTDVWNPETDPALAENFSAPRNGDVRDLTRAKGACKSDLQRRQGLPVRGDVPLFGMISRLTDQKGLDLTVDCVDRAIGLDMQMTFLGTGDARYEEFLSDAARRHPEKIATTIGFDDALARRIEAGADIFLMPSRYEPCGLNQMYSQMYGTVPIVRRVGGLADSVVDASGENLEAGTATGFCFDSYESDALLEQMQRAVRSYADHGEWMKLVQAGMQQDWSWKRSASEYLTVYGRASEIHGS